MKYIVNDRKFHTLEQACEYAGMIFRLTGMVVAVEAI